MLRQDDGAVEKIWTNNFYGQEQCDWIMRLAEVMCDDFLVRDFEEFLQS